jgi:hypothetical protein
VKKPFLNILGLVTLLVIYGLWRAYNSDEGYVSAAASFVGPFILLGLVIVWIAVITFPAVFKNLRTKNGNSTNLKEKLSVGTAVLGICLIAYFVAIGGPNRGMGKHVFNTANNPYIDLQIGVGLIILATVFSSAVKLKRNK